MKLQLPNVALVIVETQVHKLAAMAVQNCLAVADFGDVLIISDDFTEFTFPARHLKVENWPTKMAVQRFIYSQFNEFQIKADYILFIEWDSWIINPAEWSPEFLAYDYIGAPWGYADGYNVGNGGFSLRTTRLMQHLWTNYASFKMNSSLGDSLVCRNYRARLETVGFKWAPEELAHHFSFERYVRPDLVSCPFGFHGMFNWCRVLSRKDLVARLLIAQNFPYIINNPPMWDYLFRHDPTLIKEFADAFSLDQTGQDDVGHLTRLAAQEPAYPSEGSQGIS